MKKEFFAGVLFLVVFTLVLVNINRLDTLCTEVNTYISKTATYAETSDFDLAKENAEHAITAWKENDLYTHTVLRHADVDSVTDSLYELLISVSSENENRIKATARKASSTVDSLKQAEHLRLSSIL